MTSVRRSEARRRLGFALTMLIMAVMPGMAHAAPAKSATATITAPLPSPPVMSSRPRSITLNLKDASVVDVFRLLAEQNNLNIIVAPEVTGTVSLRLTDVLFEDALKVVLDTTNMQMRKTGKIIYIYPKSAGSQQVEDQVTEIFDIKFIRTDNLLPIITPMLSEGAKIQTFAPNAQSAESPSLVITDLPENIERARKMIERLDIEQAQVLIEAKIVSTSLSNDEVFGADWTTAANFTGLPFKLDSRFLAGGKMDFGTLSLNQVRAVYQRLSTNGKSNILSDIQIATLDGSAANIHVGEKVPVGLSSLTAGPSGGTLMGTTGIQEFKVGVTLEVTPRVLSPDVIRLDVTPDVSNISGFTSLGGGVSQAPITSNRTAETTIMVRSGETIVIGGLMQDTTTESRKQVPVLSKLPFLGGMFRSKTMVKEKSNLLIFITARIMSKRDPTAARNEAAPTAQAPAGVDDKLNELLEPK